MVWRSWVAMPDAPKRPCCVCRRWFRPDPRVGLRQRACGQPDCQAARRVQTQKSWRARNPDYFIARRIEERGNPDQPPEPLRLPPPLSRLPWDIAQDEFGVKGADFIGIFGTVLLRAAQDQFRAYPIVSTGPADTLPPNPVQDQIRAVAESVRVGMKGHEAGVSPTGSPL
jgi:hypothetical protein